MGSLLAAGMRMHGGIERWQRISTIRATVSASRHMPGTPQPGMLFDLIASTRVAVICLEQRSHDGLISSFRNGVLSVHGADGASIVTQQANSGPSRAAWAVFGASEAIWIALNAPFVFAADALVCTETGDASRPLRRLHVESHGADGVAEMLATATFSMQGVLRTIHVRRGGQIPLLTTVGLSGYALQEGLLVARRQRLRIRGEAVGTAQWPLTLSLQSVRFD